MVQKILIAAIDKDGGIGKDGYMPWHYPADLKLFMNLTMGHTIVMGRKTFDGMFERGKVPLKGRQNIVVTSQAAEYRSRFIDQHSPSHLNFTTDLNCTDPELNIAKDAKIFYCGGANIYQQIVEPHLVQKLIEGEEIIEAEHPSKAGEWLAMRKLVGR